VTTADASLAAGDLYAISTRLEGLNTGFLGFGQTGAQSITVSFWAKHTKTGIHSILIKNGANNRSYAAEYTINTTDTWEFKTITIAGDTTGTWVNDTTNSLKVIFLLAAGTTFTTTAGSWGAGNFFGSSNQVNNLDNTSNNFKIALLQAEVGTIATPFETLPYDIVLKRARRYLFVGNVYVPATVAAVCRSWEMRATPTLTGGGAGFTSTGTTLDSLIAFQTAGAVQTITATAEL
jgi:hypothetical protein